MRATHAPAEATIGGMPDETSISHAMHGKRTPRAVDRVIAELAERQHGVVGRWQLIELGLGRGQSRDVLRGQLHRIHQGSYAVGHRYLTRHARVTSVPRTLMDLAGLVNKRQLEKAFNEMQVKGLTDKLSLPVLLARYPNRRGALALQALLADEGSARGKTRSTLEERFLALLQSTDLPRPRLNADVRITWRQLRDDGPAVIADLRRLLRISHPPTL